MIIEHVTEFQGLPVVQFEPAKGLGNAARNAWRISVEYDDPDTVIDKLAELVGAAGASQIRALVFGPWFGDDMSGSTEEIVDALVGSAKHLPALEHLFIGDVIYEECEISWITQSDLHPLLKAFPALHTLRVRGGTDLSLGDAAHGELRALIIEAGGLPPTVLTQIARAGLPSLEHLELWLGTQNYGGPTRMSDITPVLRPGLFPRLRYLGLRDSEMADEIAAALASSELLATLTVLDLSLGTLSDEGAQALIASPHLRSLARLDLHHHYLSDAMMARLRALPITVDVSDRQELEDGDRYVAVAE